MDQTDLKICWLLGPECSSYAGMKDKMHSIAPLWGSHETWRNFDTTNVIVHDLSTCRNLIKRAFHSVTKMYIPDTHFVDLGRPMGVSIYGGGFDGNMAHKDSIIAAHLVGNLDNAVVLMLGWDLSVQDIEDEYQKLIHINYLKAIKTVIHNHPDTQWVLIDAPTEPHSEILNEENFVSDSWDTVMELLGHSTEEE